jgi:hypothetical protein
MPRKATVKALNEYRGSWDQSVMRDGTISAGWAALRAAVRARSGRSIVF